MSRTFQLHLEELSDRVVPSVVPAEYSAGVTIRSELDAEFDAFIAAGGTFDAMHQTAGSCDPSCGTGSTIVIDGVSIAVSATVLTYASTNAPNADDSDEPLTVPQLHYLTRYLEILAAGKPLSSAQLAEMNGWLHRLQKHGFEGSGEQQLKDLNAMLEALNKIVSKPAPLVGVALDLYTKMVDAIISGVSKNIKEAEYAKFKQTMDAKPANMSLKDYYEENKGGFAAGLVDLHYIRYQAELLKDKLSKLPIKK